MFSANCQKYLNKDLYCFMFLLISFSSVMGSHAKVPCIQKVLVLHTEKHCKTVNTMSENGTQLQRKTHMPSVARMRKTSWQTVRDRQKGREKREVLTPRSQMWPLLEVWTFRRQHYHSVE